MKSEKKDQGKMIQRKEKMGYREANKKNNPSKKSPFNLRLNNSPMNKQPLKQENE